jgi:hypothetical protein
MLLSNVVKFGGSPMRKLGGLNPATLDRETWITVGGRFGFDVGAGTFVAGESVSVKSALPQAYRHPYSWRMPREAGSLGSFNEISGEGAIDAANLAGGLAAVSSMTGAGTLSSAITGLAEVISTLTGAGTLSAERSATAVLEATIAGVGDVVASIVALLAAEATLSGSGEISSAEMESFLALAATIAASGALTGDLAGALAAQASLSGTGSVAANLNAIAGAAAGLSGSGTLVGALLALGNAVATVAGTGAVSGTMRADGALEAEINVANSDPLSPNALAAAVWNALAAEFNATGSFGELVQNNVGVDYDRILREIRDALVPHIWGAS